MDVAILGRGKVGKSLARALSVRALPGRAVPQAKTVVLAVPDGALAECADRIAPRTKKSVVLHCAGALDARVLAPCKAQGAAVGVMHPLSAFAGPRASLEGVVFVLSGDARAVASAKRIVRAVGGRALVHAVHGPAYHAVAALVANGSTTLAARGVRALTALGMPDKDARVALAGLLHSVAASLATHGEEALTGPVRRGDAETVARHRSALRDLDPAAAKLYEAITPHIVALAASLGTDPAALERILRRR